MVNKRHNDRMRIMEVKCNDEQLCFELNLFKIRLIINHKEICLEEYKQEGKIKSYKIGKKYIYVEV
jgi:hypothetical protein